MREPPRTDLTLRSYEYILTGLTGRTIEQINQEREQARAGSLEPIRELLYDSALLLQGAAFGSIDMAAAGIGFEPNNVDCALRAIEACKQIFMVLAEHTNTNALSGIASNLFQENLERIMKYIARKGGVVKRYELLTSRVIQGNAMDYDKHLAALIDSGYIAATQTGRRKEITYSITPNEAPLIEVFEKG